MGAAATGAMVLIGDKLGLYKALAAGEPLTSSELAAQTHTAERYVREWLASQAAAGYVQYQAETGRYFMTTEQALVLADEKSPAFMAGGFDVISAMFQDEPKITEAFQSGRGVGWHEHCPCLFRGTERFFRTGYTAHLVDEWLPRHSTGLSRNFSAARVWPMLAVATAFPRSSWPRHFRNQALSASTIIRHQWNARAKRPVKRALLRIVASKWPTPRTSRDPTTTWSRSSIAFTTWATQWARRNTSANRFTPKERGSSWNHLPRTAWRRTSTPLGG